MCDSLGKTFLLPSWFAEDFKDEPFASLLEIFFFQCTRLTKEESSASSRGML